MTTEQLFNPARDFPPEEVALFSDTWSGEDLWFVLHDVKQGDPDCFYPDELKIYQQYLRDKETLWDLYSVWCEISGCTPTRDTFNISQYIQFFEQVMKNEAITDKRSFFMIMAANCISPRLWDKPQCLAIYHQQVKKLLNQ